MSAPALDRVLKLVLPWLGPFVSNTLSTTDRARRKLAVDYSGTASSLQIHSHERSNGFAGLLKYTKLQRIVLEWNYSLDDQCFDADLFWLLIDNNKASLKSLEMRGFLAGLPDLKEADDFENIQVFPVYVQHLYKCDFLTHLDFQIPPPCKMWNGRLLQRMFSRLERLAIRGFDWTLIEENHFQFSDTFARASGHFGNLLQLSLSWEVSDNDEAPHLFLPFFRSANLPRLRSLVLEGFMPSQDILELVFFLNRHRLRLEEIQMIVTIDSLGSTSDLHGLGLGKLPKLKNLMLPAPVQESAEFVADPDDDNYIYKFIHLKLANIGAVCPSLVCLVLQECESMIQSDSIIGGYQAAFPLCPSLRYIIAVPAEYYGFEEVKFPFESLAACSDWAQHFTELNEEVPVPKDANSVIWSWDGPGTLAHCSLLGHFKLQKEQEAFFKHMKSRR